MDMHLNDAINTARLAKAIHADQRDVPANAALVVLADEVERLRKLAKSVCVEAAREPFISLNLSLPVEKLRQALEDE